MSEKIKLEYNIEKLKKSRDEFKWKAINELNIILKVMRQATKRGLDTREQSIEK